MSKKFTVYLINAFFLFLLLVYNNPPLVASSSTPVFNNEIDTLSYFLTENNKLREILISGNFAYWRDSASNSMNDFSQNWNTALLSQVWDQNVWPEGHSLPVDGGIDGHAYQQFNVNCGRYENNVTEVVIKGSELWYRTTSKDKGFSGVKFNYSTLATAWGSNGPPTDSINSIHYDFYLNLPREVVQKGENVWVRNYSCDQDKWGDWNKVTLTQAWGNTEGEGNSRFIPNCGFYCAPPPLNGQFNYFTANNLDSKYAEEIVINGDYVYSRRSNDTNLSGVTKSGLWRITKISDFFSRYDNSIGIKDIALGYVNDYLNIYENTDFAPILDDLPYIGNNTIRAYVGGASALIVRGVTSDNMNARALDIAKVKERLLKVINYKDKWYRGGQYKLDFSTLSTRGVLLNSLAIYDSFSDVEKASLETLAKEEGDYWIALFKNAQNNGWFLPYMNGYGAEDFNNDGYPDGNTRSEENVSKALLFATTASFFPTNVQAPEWEYAGRCFAYHTVTTSTDKSYCGIKTQTVYDDFSVQNHNIRPSVVYSLAIISSIQQAGLAFNISDRKLTNEYLHNLQPIWSNMLSYYYPSDYSIKPEFFRGMDWGDKDIWLMTPDFNYSAYVDNTSHLSVNEIRDISDDFQRYFYFMKKGKTRIGFNNSPISVISELGINETSTYHQWFTNSLTSGKGSAELLYQSHMKEIFCKPGTFVNKLGIPTEYCGAPAGSGDKYAMNAYITSYAQNYNGTHPDANLDSKVNSKDYNQILTFFSVDALNAANTNKNSSVSLIVDNPNVYINKEFEIKVEIDPSTDIANSADIEINFDQNNFTLISIEEVDSNYKLVPTTSIGSFDFLKIVNNANITGKIKLGFVNYDFTNQKITQAIFEPTVIALIKIKPKPGLSNYWNDTILSNNQGTTLFSYSGDFNNPTYDNTANFSSNLTLRVLTNGAIYDLNNDDKINFEDATIFSSNYFNGNLTLRENDYNQDNKVNIQDLIASFNIHDN